MNAWELIVEWSWIEARVLWELRFGHHHECIIFFVASCALCSFDYCSWNCFGWSLDVLGAAMNVYMYVVMEFCAFGEREILQLKMGSSSLPLLHKSPQNENNQTDYNGITNLTKQFSNDGIFFKI